MNRWGVGGSAMALMAICAFRGISAQQQPAPPFETNVNYVRVDMYPTRNGVPVPDLAAEDVEILEDKVPQTIAKFELVSITGPRAQSSRPDPSTLDAMRRAASDTGGRLVVLFLDPKHVDVRGSMEVRRPLIDALNALIGDDDLIAVMTPAMSVQELTFVRRTGSIEQLLAGNWGERGWLGTRDEEEIQYEACYDSPTKGDGISKEMIARRREVQVIDALDNLVQYLPTLREQRTAVIAISDGWELYGPSRTLAGVSEVPVGVPPLVADPRTGKPTTANRLPMSLDRQHCETARAALASLEDEERFKRIMQSANRGNVSFYPIGPGGFSATYEPMSAQNRSLHMRADLTDGTAIVRPTEMDNGLRRMIADLSSYYLAGYYSTAKPDGKFHRITVRVKRPGIDVRARSGYLAATAPAENAIRKPAALSPADAADARLISRALGELEALVREDPPRPATASANGVRFFRRGVTTGNKDAATGDLRYRRTERLAIELPAAASEPFSARLIDRTGKPLSIPVAAAVRQDADGPRGRIDLNLAPLAPADYLIEITAGSNRTFAAFRIVP